MNPFGPIIPGVGPQPAKIMLIGGAPDEHESDKGKPFVGPSGWELRRMLRIVGINMDDCYVTNVFSRQPSQNNVALYGVDRSDASSCAIRLGPLTTNPITYIADQHLPELERLRAEILAVNPNIVIALGNTACWALLGQSGINNLRGSVHVSDFLPGRPLKVLPTFHPAAILRQWSDRVIAIADLEKAHVESQSLSFGYSNTELWLNPTLDDLGEFARRYLVTATELAVDVETKRGQITCLSFAPRPDVSLVIPFWNEGDDPNYWRLERDELAAWEWVKFYMEDPQTVKVMQNGMYDTQYFLRHGITPRNFSADTMLAHHSLYSELRKGLGFLGSIYANVPSWKKMRTYKLEEQLKRDD